MTANATEKSDPLVDSLPSRYVVGIDLGTTNSAVTFVDTQSSKPAVQTFLVKQLVAPSEIEARETIPSFHFQPPTNAIDTLRLPWQQKPASFCVGFHARDEASKAPTRAIASAKSWLCHNGVDRRAEILPWRAADDVDRLSPVEVTARYLNHIRQAWDFAFGQHPLSEQDVVITLPASFDEVARELTIQAAKIATLPRLFLIEEPQAAFYAWVDRHAEDWESRIQVGQKILVCDIGGGTTDFTLIRAQPSEAEKGKVQFHRVAVGNHLILGGDNLDLALAKHLEQKATKGKGFDARTWDLLLGQSRQAKETLLSEGAPEQLTLHLAGAGRKLIGGGLQIEVTREEVEKLLVEGFLPRVALNAQPDHRASGFQEFGLPYANDPAISRYLASFLTAHRDRQDARPAKSGQSAVAGKSAKVESEKTALAARPDLVLFNGGFFASPLLRNRVLQMIAEWFQTSAEPDWQPIVLINDRLDLAVARGAAYYGLVRRGQGVRITAALARSYYVGLAGGENRVFCLLPGNAEAGQEFELPQSFQLTLSQPVEFALFVSSTRLTDQAGDVIELNLEQMRSLPPIRTVIRTQSRNEQRDVPVRIRSRMTEIGTIEVSCHEQTGDRSWKLQFDVRSATQTEIAAHTGTGEAEGIVDESQWRACKQLIAATFEVPSTKPAQLVNDLATLLDAPREQWPMSLLRQIWEALMQQETGRRISASHEGRWLNLLGYALRPGYGFAVDDWRVTETWRHIHGKLVHATPDIRKQSLILWRRIAGGLTTGQQLAIADPLLAIVRNLHRRLTGRKGTAATLRPEESIEVWRLLGSLELINATRKTELATIICELLEKPSMSVARDAMVWALGRLGQRCAVYGPLNTVLPAETVVKWLPTIMNSASDVASTPLALVQISRLTQDRYRDLPTRQREQVSNWLRKYDAAEHLVSLVENGGQFSIEEQSRAFGESLPKGLRLE
jgi:hypothetical protein